MKEKEIKVLRVKPHEHPEVYMLKNTLEAMQEAVGGYIDIVGLDDNVCILLNDEGKLIGLEGNRRIGSDIIVGDFFVCGSDEEGNLTSLSEEALDTYRHQRRPRSLEFHRPGIAQRTDHDLRRR